MSVFDELDHRLNRHAKEPVPTCIKCFPDLELVPESLSWTPPEKKWWDHSGLRGPDRLANWGDIWMKGDQPLVFVRVDDGPGGCWVPLEKPVGVLSWHSKQPINILHSHIDQPLQIEIGTEEFNLRVRTLGHSNLIPENDPAPFGVDMVEWAAEQNRARLLEHIEKELMFPIAPSITSQSRSTKTMTYRIEETIAVVPLRGTIYQIDEAVTDED